MDIHDALEKHGVFHATEIHLGETLRQTILVLKLMLKNYIDAEFS